MEVVAELKYTKIREIGAGQGMNSKVYVAHDPQLAGRIAVKEIDKANLGNTVSDYFAEAQAMFQTEHQNVVAIRYAGQSCSSVCMAMPYYKRGSLADRIADRPLALGEVFRVARGVLAGLAHIHAAKYIHFDVKPSNVLFSDQDEPMVADFGQSRSISAMGVVKVPALYYRALPPETLACGVGTFLADIYQMGLLLYRAVNGDPLYSSQVVTEERVRRGKVPDRARFMPHVPKRLRTVIRKALSVDPAKRYQSATAMADALNRVPLSVNWIVEPFQTTGFRWKGVRDGLADLIVELAPKGNMWSVQTFSQQSAKRARDKAANWRCGLTLPAAHTHLKDVFERLQE